MSGTTALGPVNCNFTPSSGSWNTPNNWGFSVVPRPVDSALVDAVANSKTVTIAAGGGSTGLAEVSLLGTSSSTATVNMTGGILSDQICNIANPSLGSSATGVTNCVFNQSGGVHTVSQTLTLGISSINYPLAKNAQYNLSGTAILNTSEVVGVGQFNQSGGTHNANKVLHSLFFAKKYI